MKYLSDKLKSGLKKPASAVGAFLGFGYTLLILLISIPFLREGAVGFHSAGSMSMFFTTILTLGTVLIALTAVSLSQGGLLLVSLNNLFGGSADMVDHILGILAVLISALFNGVVVYLLVYRIGLILSRTREKFVKPYK